MIPEDSCDHSPSDNFKFFVNDARLGKVFGELSLQIQMTWKSLSSAW